MLHKVGKFLTIAVTSALTACGSGISSPSSSTTDTYNTHDGYSEEYRSAISRLDLPDGVAWPATPTPPESPTRYAQGAGITHAELFWLCAWKKEWLYTRTINPEISGEALQKIKQAKDLQLYRVALDPEGRKVLDRAITEADIGNPSGIQADVKANCN